VTKAVQGAHTPGFNTDSMGIAVLGTFTTSDPHAAVVNAIAKLTAWKLGLFGAGPSSRTTLVSGGGNRFKAGTKVKLNVIFRTPGRLRDRMSWNPSPQEARPGPDQLRAPTRPLTARAAPAGPPTGGGPTGLLTLASRNQARPQQEAETVL
jgi:hypothetical protein